MAEGGGDGDHEPGIVWACTECGRHHQKHSPPCKRCGNVHLEQQRPEYSDLEAPGGTSYLDVLEPKYALGYLAVVGFAVLVALSLTGVVSVPFLGGPSPPGAPGEAETYRNVSLQAVEDAYLDTLNEQRADASVDTLSTDPTLDDAATAFNQRRVRAAGGDGDPPVMEEILKRYDPDCTHRIRYDSQVAPASAIFGSPRDGGDPAAVAEALPIQASGESYTLVTDEYDSLGVDVHVAPDGAVFTTVIAC